MENQRAGVSYRYFDLVMAVFVTVLIISNIASSAKIIDWGVSLAGVRLAFDAGTLLFPVSYIFGDVLTEIYGFQRARRVIWAGFACLGLSALVLAVVRALPGETAWQGYAGQAAYDAILGGVSSGGIVLASLLGYWLGSFSNAAVMSWMKVLTNRRWLWLRTIGSTLVGEALDTLAFVAVATLAGVFPGALFASLVLTNYVFKVAVEALMTPVTYLVVRFLARAEGQDALDIGVSRSPFARSARSSVDATAISRDR